jgi:hypothetical protein
VAVSGVWESDVSTGRARAVEREAERLYAELLARRTARFVTADVQFRADVLARLHQKWRGDVLPRQENPDD